MDSINLGLTLLGIAISAAGFAITWQQLRKTQNSVDAAKAATERALEGMAVRLTIDNIGEIKGAIKSIRASLRVDRFEYALIHLQLAIELLHALRWRLGFQDEGRHVPLAAIVRQLVAFEAPLEKKLRGTRATLDLAGLNALLTEASLQLTQWGEQLKLPGAQNDSPQRSTEREAGRLAAPVIVDGSPALDKPLPPESRFTHD